MKVFKPNHSEPGAFWFDYILLPYGEFYEPTKGILDAKKGDILRFFNGDDVPIENVVMMDINRVFDVLCRMRYGIGSKAVLRKWQDNARIQGHGRDIISTEKCILVMLDRDVAKL